MADYRTYRLNKQGEMVDVPVEEFAKFLGLSNYDAIVLFRGMNITKTICGIVGQMESPPLIWNQNMPSSLVDFVSSQVWEKLKSNPGFSAKDFDIGLLYDGDNLKYRE